MPEELTETRIAESLFGEAQKNWGWLLGLGVVSVILGTIGLGMTAALTLTSVLFFGILLAVGGAFQLVDAFKCKGWKGTLLHVLIGLVYLGTGIVMAADPLGAAVALTLLVGIAFVAVGVLRIGMALQHRGRQGWVWALIGGVVSIVLGVLVMSQWPVSGLWVLGLIIAVELIVNGWTYVFIGLAARRARAEGEAESPA
ncbi:MAG: HdeD family acid-resistance protein [Pseudomonadota bacterium]|nr:HdeD family acid-resistance protein [Pseudomonadota bacterium]